MSRTLPPLVNPCAVCAETTGPGPVVGGCAVRRQPGCVQRRLTIRSNPPGVVMQTITPSGPRRSRRTPSTTAPRKVRLSLSGYETLSVLQPLPTPWYQYPGLDFVKSENLVPGEIRDERVVEYQLKIRKMIVPSQQLLGVPRICVKQYDG